MQRIYFFIIIVLIVLVYSYYKPLRDIISPEEKANKSISSDKKSSKKGSEFDELRIELYIIANKVANLQGKIQLLKMAQENRDWFKEEEYAQLPILLEKAEKDLKEAEEEYEKVKNRYARETVTQMVKESLKIKEKGRADSLEKETLP
jgi:hypothetical protein